MIIITKKQDCCGCSACANKCPKACITMSEDDEGFLYPVTDKNLCNDCHLCKKVCPMLNSAPEQLPPNVYACKNTTEDIRLGSSSGGVFTLLAEHVLNNKGIVFGAMFDSSFNVAHGWIEDTSELNRLRGSKYVQSSMGSSYKTCEAFLKQNKQVLFSGTPCQIAGLKTYLKREYDDLITIDIACHGVPSPKVFRKYIETLEKDNNASAKSIQFRNKKTGWKRYSIVIDFSDKTYSSVYDMDPYMKGFLKDLYLRPSCHHCSFNSTKKYSDITLADYWGVHTKYPEFDDDKGVSLILTHTQKGKDLFHIISSDMEVLTSDFQHAVRHNPCMVKPVPPHPKREEFFSNIDSGRLDELVKCYTKESALTKAKNMIRRVLGKVKRVLLPAR